MNQWPNFDEEPERVVEADATPSPTYATPIPVTVTPQSRVRQFGHEVANVGLAILLLLVGVVTWILLALPAGVLGCLAGLVVSGALIAGMLSALRASLYWRW
jgi:hypothetical protein